MDLFLHIFIIFNYCNFDIRMFVLRLSVSAQECKKIFGIINKQGVGGGVNGGIEINIGV